VATTLYYDAMSPSPTGRAGPSAPPLAPSAAAARETLDAWVREVIDWHFDPASGCPFWLEFAQKSGWDPRREIRTFTDLKRFGEFQDEWLRGGPGQRLIPKGLAGERGFVCECSGMRGVPTPPRVSA